MTYICYRRVLQPLVAGSIDEVYATRVAKSKTSLAVGDGGVQFPNYNIKGRIFASFNVVISTNPLLLEYQ